MIDTSNKYPRGSDRAARRARQWYARSKYHQDALRGRQFLCRGCRKWTPWQDGGAHLDEDNGLGLVLDFVCSPCAETIVRRHEEATR